MTNAPAFSSSKASKVEAENDYNELAGREERLDIAENQLTVNIIYVKDGQRYFTYRSDCASADGSWITDPLVQIYTGQQQADNQRRQTELLKF